MKHHNVSKNQGSLFFIVLLVILAIPIVIESAFPRRVFSASVHPVKSTSIGDLGRGEKLFMGYLHFQNGGPPCMGCHNIDSDGLLGGGVLGPDLTEVSSRYTNASLAQALADFPWPTMKPIYADHPLTPQEQADLQVFLEASAGRPRTNRELWLLGLSLGGLAAVTGLFGFLYRRRLRAVRVPLVEKSQVNPKG